MATKLTELILTRRTEIKAQMKELRGELAQIETVLSQLKSEAPASHPTAAKSGSRGKTIKDLAIEILNESQDGLETHEIIEKIKDKFGKDIARSSMSPQLSRLKADGLISQRDHVWISNALDQDLNTEDQDQSREGHSYDL